MNYSREKENKLNNSKLEMSIKPFTTVREETIKEKSTEKNRKGISRVSSCDSKKNPQVTSHKYLFTSSGTQFHQTQPNPTNSQYKTMQPQYDKKFNFVLEPHQNVNKPQSSNLSMGTLQQEYENLKQKYDLVYSEQVVIEKENLELEKETERWKKQYSNLYNETKIMQSQITELEQNLIFKEKCLQDRQEEITQKQSIISKLMDQGESKRKQIEESERKEERERIVRQYEAKMEEMREKQLRNLEKITLEYENKIDDLMQETSRLHKLIEQKSRLIREKQNLIQEKESLIKEKQNIIHEQLTEEENKRSSRTEREKQQIEKEVRRVEQEIKKIREENIEVRERNRQLLIKFNLMEGENINMENKHSFYKQECEKLTFTLSSLETEIQNLTHQLSHNKKEADLAHKFRQQNEELKKYYYENQELKELIAEYEKKVKELDKRRISQIEYHQEEIKRIQGMKQDKVDAQTRIYIQECDRAKKEAKQIHEMMGNKESEHQSIVSQITRDYEALIFEMKERMIESEKKQRIESQKYQFDMEIKFHDIDELQTKVKMLEGEKDLLLGKLRERNKSSSSLQYSESKNELARSRRQFSSGSAQENSEMNEISQIREKNRDLSQKVKDYEMQIIKLEDKIHLSNIEGEKNRDKFETFERKIKHLQEQISHYEAEKSKAIEERIRYTEQIQNLKREIKQRQEQIEKLEQSSAESLNKFTTIEEILKETQEKNKLLNDKIEVLIKEITIKDQNSEKLMSEIRIVKDKYAQSLKKGDESAEVIKKKEIDAAKLKECINLLKEENEIYQQKNKMRELLNKKEQNSEKEIRMQLLQKVFVAFEAKNQFNRDNHELDILRKLIPLTYSKAEAINTYMRSISQLERRLKEKDQSCETDQNLRNLVKKYQQKSEEYARVILEMEEGHKEKMRLVKEDYDVVYGKYLKYRTMAIGKIPNRH